MKQWLTVDPGEETGYAVWVGDKLRWASQLPMWEFIDAVDEWAHGALPPPHFIPQDADLELGAIVCEDWALYPWKLDEMGWDKCRTARAIGALELIARQINIPFILQPANIKQAAKAMGAEDLYLEPVNPNRHANDAIQHGVYYTGSELKAPC